jgi:hypothetical protein
VGTISRLIFEVFKVLLNSVFCLLGQRLWTVVSGILVLTASTSGQNLSTIGSSDPVRLGGSVSARAVLYSANEIRNRREPFSWVLGGSLNLNVYDVDLPFSFTYSEQERDFSQPFNQFGASPSWQWLRGHVGYRALTFSPYTLAGHQFLGGAVEGNPGLFRFGLMYGRLRRAVEEDTSTSRFVLPAYARTGYALRAGVGNSSSYVDLILLKAKDDPSSLRRAPMHSLVLPGENLVLGLSGTAEVVSGLRVTLDAAVSDYARDQRAREVEADGGMAAGVIEGMQASRSSTQYYGAVKAAVAWSRPRFGITGTYHRVDPDYQSMGAYYMANDLQSVAIAPRVVLLDGALRINGTVTYRHDNLQNKKRATTHRLMPVVALSIMPAPRWGVDVQYTDVFTSQTAGYASLGDSTRIDQRNPMISVMPRYTFTTGGAMHAVMLGAMHMRYVDNNPATARYARSNSTNLNLGYTVTLSAQQLSLTAAGNTTRLENAGGVYRNSGVSLTASKSLLAQSLRLNAGATYSFQGAGRTVTASAGASYALRQRHNFSAQSTLVSSSAGYYAQDMYSELTLVLGYAYTF